MLQKNMYVKSAMQWNPFVGCEFDCEYCRTSFKAQKKRQKHLCQACYEYAPHNHPERLRAPLSKTEDGTFIFTCSSADISFCEDDFAEQIMNRIRERQDRTFLLQSKNPATFERFNPIPENVILGTTLETNRSDMSAGISKAPAPEERYRALKALKHDRKMITVEPAMIWDHDAMVDWIVDVNPVMVWLGVNSKPKPVLSEPTPEEFYRLRDALERAGLQVILKTEPGKRSDQIRKKSKRR